MAKSATVYDVAVHAGVSIATVSRTLRRPEDVRETTRALVLASVSTLGYVPSASARSLAARRTEVLGLYLPSYDALEQADEAELVASNTVEVVNDIPGARDTHPLPLYFDEVLRGGELEARRQGHALMVGVGRESNREKVFNEFAGRVDGIAVMSHTVPDELLDQVARRIPVVLIAGPRRGDRFDHVSVSNAEGMRALTQHLIAQHSVREPVYVSGSPLDSPDDAERYQGFVQALSDNDIDASSLRVVSGGFSRIRARDSAESLLADGGALPRALVCANDQMALGILDVFTRRGIRVPEDVIVTGFDGIEEADLATPRVTTVHQPMVDLGRAAMQTMLSRLADPAQPPITVRLPVRVLLRESCEGSH